MTNYFEVLGLEEKFDLSPDLINRQYFAAQKVNYPDRATGDMQKSLLLNEAYLILLDPLARAHHLLELNGVDLGSSILDLKMFQDIMSPSKTLESSMAKLAEAFREDDLDRAHSAWCECQYVKRLQDQKSDRP